MTAKCKHLQNMYGRTKYFAWPGWVFVGGGMRCKGETDQRSILHLWVQTCEQSSKLTHNGNFQQKELLHTLISNNLSYLTDFREERCWNNVTFPKLLLVGEIAVRRALRHFPLLSGCSMAIVTVSFPWNHTPFHLEMECTARKGKNDQCMWESLGNIDSLWILGVALCRGRSWTRWSLWVPSNSGHSVVLWPVEKD